MPKADDIETRFRTAGHFTEALKKNLFALYCQPIVMVESAKVDYKYLEIFVRFREEEDKLLPPGTSFRASTSTSPTTRFATRISADRCAISSRRRESRPTGCGSR